MDGKFLIVDLQFVIGNNNQYYLKEMATNHNTSIITMLYHFKPPYPKEELNVIAKNQNNYNQENINGLNWSDGQINYNDIPAIMESFSIYDKIYVKGLQKKTFLEKYLTNQIIDWENDIPPLTKLLNYDSYCQIHLKSDSHKKKCAVKNCINILMHGLKQNKF